MFVDKIAVPKLLVHPRELCECTRVNGSALLAKFQLLDWCPSLYPSSIAGLRGSSFQARGDSVPSGYMLTGPL